MRAIYRLRTTVEPELAALSAPGRTDAEIDELDDLVRRTFRDVLGEAFWAPHRAFHAALIEPAASVDPRMLTPLWDASERCTRLVFARSKSPSPSPRTGRAHDELVDATADLASLADTRRAASWIGGEIDAGYLAQLGGYLGNAGLVR